MSFEDGAISRRAMLALLGGVVVVAGGAAVATRLVSDDDSGSSSSGTAAADTVARIGREYIALVPAEDTLAALREKLPELTGDEIAQLGSLKAKSQADFESGDVVVIDGWVLSRTEARAAALVALSQG